MDAKSIISDTAAEVGKIEAAAAIDIEKVKELVEAWFREHICRGPIAQHTPAYNQAHAAKETLVQKLEDLWRPAVAAISEAVDTVEKAAGLGGDDQKPQ